MSCLELQTKRKLRVEDSESPDYIIDVEFDEQTGLITEWHPRKLSEEEAQRR